MRRSTFPFSTVPLISDSLVKSKTSIDLRACTNFHGRNRSSLFTTTLTRDGLSTLPLARIKHLFIVFVVLSTTATIFCLCHINDDAVTKKFQIRGAFYG